MAEIFEIEPSRKHDVALDPEQQVRRLRYCVFGTVDDAEVGALVESTIPAFYQNQRFRNYTIDPQGNGVWFVDVTYGRQKPPGLMTFNFDTTGEKTKITQSFLSQYFVVPGPVDKPARSEIDFQNAVNVKRSGGTIKVEGVEVGVRKFDFTITRTFGPEAALDGDVVQMIFDKTEIVNSDVIDVTFFSVDLHFEPGELLFKGATGSQKSGGANPGEPVEWEGEITLKFSASPNLLLTKDDYDFLDADVTISKKGWDYLWIAYEEDVSSNVIIPKPLQVCVEQVIEDGELAPLFFGGDDGT